MTTEAVPEWLEFYKNDMPVSCESVQSGNEILRNIEQRVTSLQKFADVIYSQWIKGFTR
jgi:hypothetical protein